LAKVDAEQKKGIEILGLADKALGLEAERMRWPILLEELRAKSKAGMWVTQLALAVGDLAAEGDGTAGTKPGAPKIAVPVLELGGFFETKSEDPDAKVVEAFRLRFNLLLSALRILGDGMWTTRRWPGWRGACGKSCAAMSAPAIGGWPLCLARVRGAGLSGRKFQSGSRS
jgi:hypothetical protein